MDKLHFHRKLPKLDINRVFGPDMHGAWYRPVSQRHDYLSGVTTVFFQPVPPKDLPKQMLTYSQRIQTDRKDPRQWLNEVVEQLCQNRKWLNLLARLPTSLQSGFRPIKEESAATALTSSQRELLKRFRKPGSQSPGHGSRRAKTR